MATKKRSEEQYEDVPSELLEVDASVVEPVNVAAQEIAQAREEHAAPRPRLIPIRAYVMNKFGAKNVDAYGAFFRFVEKKGITRAEAAHWDALLESFQNRRIGG